MIQHKLVCIYSLVQLPTDSPYWKINDKTNTIKKQINVYQRHATHVVNDYISLIASRSIRV